MSAQPLRSPRTNRPLPRPQRRSRDAAPVRTWTLVAAATASALAYAVYAQATWPWIALGWVGLVPWLAVLDHVHTLRRAAVAGVVMAIAFEIAVFGWFAFAIGDYTGAPAALVNAAITTSS